MRCSGPDVDARAHDTRERNREDERESSEDDSDRGHGDDYQKRRETSRVARQPSVRGSTRARSLLAGMRG